MDPARARHWQDVWARAAVAIARRVPGRGKYYVVNAYAGPSGFLHVGHLRGYAYQDALLRYHRMRGEEVLLPYGVHASGLPAVAWAQKVRDRDPLTLAQLDEAGVTAEVREKLEEPEEVVRFFARSYLEVLRSFGVLVDETTSLTTIDDDYEAFIRWQFHALRDAGALVQGTHYASVCPVCGPVAVDAAETDLSQGGDAEVVTFTTVPFRLDDGRILLAATLRPETVYGVTNLWVAPGVPLVVWHLGAEAFLVSRAGAERLVEQHGGRLGKEEPIDAVVGRTVRVPFRDRSVPVLASPVVDPAVGTGVVMSVPAHAPADAAAIADLPPGERTRLGEPPLVLEIPETGLAPSEGELLAGTGTPAARALRAVGAQGLADRARIDLATERLYRLEFARGRMTVPEHPGARVPVAREEAAEHLAKDGASPSLREFSVRVVCRNDHDVIIRRVPDQWFLRYSDPAWKEATREAMRGLTTWPSDYGRELPAILDWFEDRPCTRHGRWLGTPFPFDPSWTIEPIADSTFYMAYFVVRRFVSTGRLTVEQLTDPFFDFVFRGLGPGEPRVDRSLLEEVRAEFLYWYPLDVNLGGKEHRRVHFPAFLFTHARLLPPELQPRGIFVNGWITGPSGDKLSKKEIAAKGGRIPPIREALERWGADGLRLFYLLAVSPGQDLEFDPDLAESAADRVREVERTAREAIAEGDGPPELDAWLASRAHRVIARVRDAYDTWEFRVAAETTFVELPALLRRYYARGGTPGTLTHRLALAWIRLLAPIAPHLAEELGEGRFPGLVAQASFPDPEEFTLTPHAELRETYLERVEEDLRAVLRPISDRGDPLPAEAVFYVASPWKRTVEEWLRQANERGEAPTVRSIFARAEGHPELAAARPFLARYVERVAPLVRAESEPSPELDETATLRAAEGYLARRLGFRTLQVVPEAEAASLDPLGRRERARPGRPAFYLLGVEGRNPR
jgi:leucyl-tRNA synthetase